MSLNYLKQNGDIMEKKIKKITGETITKNVVDGKTPMMVLEIQQDELKDAFNKAQKEYPNEVGIYTTRYIDLHPIANIIMTIRSIDNLIAIKYLNDQVSSSEFDHMRIHIGIYAYFYYKHIIEEVEKDKFFTEASIKASEKFLKEIGDDFYVK